MTSQPEDFEIREVADPANSERRAFVVGVCAAASGAALLGANGVHAAALTRENAMSDPMPGRSVNIYVTRDVAYDLKKLEVVTRKVLGVLGCGGCHSGHILNFQALSEFVVNPQTLDVQELPALTAGMR